MLITKRRFRTPTWDIKEDGAWCRVVQNEDGLFQIDQRTTTYETIEDAATEGLESCRRFYKNHVLIVGPTR